MGAGGRGVAAVGFVPQFTYGLFYRRQWG